MKADEALGPYRILDKLGEGGMGEVYRATDTNLKRQVAIKVLPASVAGDTERLARFQREAEVLAALNHPHIAAIYGLEKTPEFTALVMELVEGEDLSQRIARGAIPIDEALPIARQIAEALEAAHEQGIVHRDLKPANIKLRADGTVKVLDFGLAKAMDPGLGVGDRGFEHASQAPTITTPAMTQAGMILGTAAYMAPEQARGKAVDRRADIWAFGAVLFEMLAGRRAFDGEDVAETLANVINKEPAWEVLPAAVPPRVARVLRACLQKNPKQRLDSAQAVRLALEGAFDTSVPGASASVLVREPRSRWRRALPGVAAAVLAIVSIAASVVAYRATRPVDRPLIRLSVDLGPEAVAGARTTAVLSPDGTRVVFPVRPAGGGPLPFLTIRQLDQENAVLLAGTEGASDPFFSPDGQWIGFFAAGKLKKVAAQGGAPVNLCDAPSARGGSWGEDDSIIFSGIASALMRVPAAGGIPQPVTKLAEGEVSHSYPQMLPGGTAVLFTANTDVTNFENASIDVVSLSTGDVKTVQRGGYFGRYVRSPRGIGHLLYVHEGTLFATAFDPDRLETRGSPVPLLDNVANDPNGGGQFDASRNGSLVYSNRGTGSGSYPIVWMESSGKTAPLLVKPGVYGAPRFSPEGRRLAFTAPGGKGQDVWVFDWERETPTQITFTGPGNLEPVWTPDGRYIVFGSVSGSTTALWWVRSDGSGAPQRLLEGKNAGIGFRPQSFTPDGTRLVFVDNSINGASPNIYTLPLDVSDPDHPKPGKPEPFLVTPMREVDAAVSPDGRWMAYASNESGIDDVFVRAFPGPGGKWRISTGGGKYPTWSRDGRQLFFLGGDDRIMVADYTAKGDSFDAGRPRVWSERRVLRPGVIRVLDMHPDGTRFAVFDRPGAETAAGNLHVTFLLNFDDELHRKVPVQ